MAERPWAEPLKKWLANFYDIMIPEGQRGLRRIRPAEIRERVKDPVVAEKLGPRTTFSAPSALCEWVL